jgi:hypothetical protein
MNFRTALLTYVAFPLVLLSFGAEAIWAAFFSGDDRAFYALLVGIFFGYIYVDFFYIPNTLKEWEQTGKPWEPRTPEQQELWEQKTKRKGLHQNAGIIIGILVMAFLRPHKELFPIVIALIGGFLVTWLVPAIWFIYRKRGKLGPM